MRAITAASSSPTVAARRSNGRGSSTSPPCSAVINWRSTAGSLQPSSPLASAIGSPLEVAPCALRRCAPALRSKPRSMWNSSSSGSTITAHPVSRSMPATTSSRCAREAAVTTNQRL